ncbi:MAG TPA: hypothetical protein ENK85_02545 [Saprospiraceae bacterium]|nr:hypothetical protein [Saprospiraceae bacterium]
MMKYLFSIFVLITFNMSCTSCDSISPVEKCSRDFLFSIPVTLSPALDTFRIGDTILVEMNFPIEMEDVNSGDTINMADFPFNTELALVKIDTNPSTNGNNIVEYFCFEGQLNIQPLTGGGQAVQIQFAKDTTSFSFACKILLKKKGVFAIGYGSYFLDEFDGELEIGCRTSSVDISYPLTIKNGTDSYNYHLIQQSPNPNISKITQETFDKYGEYAFVVIE